MSRTQTLAKARVQSRNKPTRKILTSRNLTIILCLLLAVATIALYYPVSKHAFLSYDDHDYVTANSHVRDGLTWSTLQWAFSAPTAANWHPLTWISHALDCQLFGLNPAGHHLHSALLHTVDALLLFLLLAWITKRRGPSLLVAALFAVHPINVESVAWIAECKNVLSTLFFFLAIGAYIRYSQKPDWRRYLLVATLFAAGLMAKPMILTLPFVLLLLDYWPLHRTPGSPPSVANAQQSTISKLLLEKLPLLFLSALSAVITMKAQRSGQAVRSLSQFPLAVRLENAVVAYASYLWKMLWPARLAPLYPHPGDTLPPWQVFLSALVLVTVMAFVIIFRRKRYLLVGWLWFLGTLVPVLGLVQVGDAAMADRYAYVPLIGIFVMIAWGLDDAAQANRIRTIWRIIPALCVLVALSLVTFRQLDYWENEFTLWSHTLAVTNRNPFAHDSLAAALLDPSISTTHSPEDLDTQQKRIESARQHLGHALDLRRQLARKDPNPYLPAIATTLNNLGFVDRLQSHPDEARQHYEEALTIRRDLAQQNPDANQPFLAITLNDLGTLDAIQKRTDAAQQHYDEALSIRRKLAR